MDIKPENKEFAPLSSILPAAWEGAFTVEAFDSKTLANILENDVAPKNAAHHTTTNSINEAAKKFYDVNGKEFFDAIAILEHH